MVDVTRVTEKNSFGNRKESRDEHKQRKKRTTIFYIEYKYFTGKEDETAKVAKIRNVDLLGLREIKTDGNDKISGRDIHLDTRGLPNREQNNRCTTSETMKREW